MSLPSLLVTLTLGGLLPCVGFAADPRSDPQPLENFDAVLEEQFQDSDQNLEAAYQVMDEALREAYEQFAKAIARTWGPEQVELPTRKVWVDYDVRLVSRRIMDFEGGALTVERLLQPGASEAPAVEAMKGDVRQALEDRSGDLAERDQGLRYAERLAAAQGVSISAPLEPPATDTDPVLKGVLPSDAPELVTAKLVSHTEVVGEDGVKRTKLTARVPFKKGYFGILARNYETSVRKHAAKRGFPPSLLLAVIQTESAFNPRATSPIPAYGLMQLVPRSGALDAYQYVYGKKRILGPDYLYRPENNIELGAAYLELLDKRYLRHIKDSQSRLFCVIAAYNTGAGNVARAFTGKKRGYPKEAASIVNNLEPDEVFAALRDKLPYQETRDYIVKVQKARSAYKAWDQSQQALAPGRRG